MSVRHGRDDGRCPKCGAYGAHDEGQRCPYDRLRDALGNMAEELTPEEDRSLHWLASTDYTTIDSLVGIFRKLRKVWP